MFCRNVLIYFDQETKIGVLNRLARQMPADGYLVLGAAETVVGLTDAFKPMADKRGLYVPNTPAAKPAPASNVLTIRYQGVAIVTRNYPRARKKNPAGTGGVAERQKRAIELTLKLSWNALFHLGRLAQHVAAAPHRLDVVLAG